MNTLRASVLYKAATAAATAAPVTLIVQCVAITRVYKMRLVVVIPVVAPIQMDARWMAYQMSVRAQQLLK